MQRNETSSRDRGEATMWLAIATPIVMILCLVLIIVIWVNTNLLVALVLFGVLMAAAIAVYTKRRNRYRGL